MPCLGDGRLHLCDLGGRTGFYIQALEPNVHVLGHLFLVIQLQAQLLQIDRDFNTVVELQQLLFQLFSHHLVLLPHRNHQSLELLLQLLEHSIWPALVFSHELRLACALYCSTDASNWAIWRF